MAVAVTKFGGPFSHFHLDFASIIPKRIDQFLSNTLTLSLVSLFIVEL